MMTTGLKCPVCENTRDLIDAGKEPWPICCFHSILNLSNVLFEAVIAQTVFHSRDITDSRFMKAVVNAAVVSPNPNVRQAARKWRNEQPE